MFYPVRQDADSLF